MRPYTIHDKQQRSALFGSNKSYVIDMEELFKSLIVLLQVLVKSYLFILT